MTKSQLIDRIAQRVPQVPRREVEAIVNAVFDCMVDALQRDERIEIRGFGSFAVKVRSARDGRNPKTGQRVKVPERRALSFTVGKELRDRLNPPAPGAEEDPVPAPLAVTSAPASAPRSAPSAAGPEGLAASSSRGARYTAG